MAFKLGAWVHEQAYLGSEAFIDNEVIDLIRLHPMPSLSRRVESYLRSVIQKMNGALSGQFSASDIALRLATWSIEENDCLAISKHLTEEGAFQIPYGSMGETLMLVAKGHDIYEKMAGVRALSTQVFVAMWFADEMNEPYIMAIKPAIQNSGYEAIRVDKVEHSNKIDDQIVADIRGSAFVVADFTGHRSGVYYEAGFAHGLNRRVIFSCREDCADGLHFDVRQYNTIRWKTTEDLLIALQNRILALFGAGPLKPNAAPISA